MDLNSLRVFLKRFILKICSFLVSKSVLMCALVSV